MSRPTNQRPEVYATGTREKLWKIEYREYFLDEHGKRKARHKSKTWSQKDHTKTQAQKLADAFMANVQAEPTRTDGEMTLRRFYESCYLPIRSRRWTGHTETSVNSLWTNHIKPAFGDVAIKDITKVAVELHLLKLADSGLCAKTVGYVLTRLRSILEEAVENDLILKNPTRRLMPPNGGESLDTRSLTIEEVKLLWAKTEGDDRIMWRLLVLTGLRIGELLPLESSDITAEGLFVHKALVRGKVKLPKRNKTRTATLPVSLRAELMGLGPGLLFPNESGAMMGRGSRKMRRALDNAKKIIPDITFRMCRTTFATLFEGEDADRTAIMGHFDEKFTNRVYRKSLEDRRQKGVDELDRRLNVVRIDKKRA